ncbi:MAG: hypothetical protein BWY72_00505 [Bacteroidetes bacterium ADurb.Bin416]|nr:MAG: hypothetical protein BWY72_00505 [Bacteroidetes bacterium ADurb.Bin416]
MKRRLALAARSWYFQSFIMESVYAEYNTVDVSSWFSFLNRRSIGVAPKTNGLNRASALRKPRASSGSITRGSLGYTLC